MLALPIYSMQVLDRVMSSHSMETLLMLSLIVIFAIACVEVLSAVRALLFTRMGQWLEMRLAPLFFEQSLAAALFQRVGSTQLLRDFQQLRQFLSSPAFFLLFDIPWALIFLIALFVLHPLLGLLALFGGLILLGLAYATEKNTKRMLDEGNDHHMRSMQQIEQYCRNAEVIQAMGMARSVGALWQKNYEKTLFTQSAATIRSGFFSELTKFFRYLVQIATTGIGAYLALHHELSSGGIIAASIITGRALAPFETAIGSWKSGIAARKSHQRLVEMLATLPARYEAMELPTPEGRLDIETLTYTPPNASKPILKNLELTLRAGEILGIIGPSASGKTTLAKLIAGVLKPSHGVVRLDGADIYHWNRADVGRHIGYLPQDIELFQGTVKENIARMDLEASAEAVVAAAQFTHLHDMILRLPQGYNTRIGNDGALLSSGQRQRIGLARAFFGSPRLVILDEPNSNLDGEGEVALFDALTRAQTLGITTLVISHRPSVLRVVTKLLILKDGQIAHFGERDAVLKEFPMSSNEDRMARS